MAKADIWFHGLIVGKKDLSEPPILFPSIPPNFYQAVGNLIVHWGLMEQQLNILVWALLKANGTTENDWRGRSFDRRYDLFKSEWERFSDGLPTLQSFNSDIHTKIRTWKVLRDAVSHKEMEMGISTDGNHVIQFYHKTRAKQKSRSYSAADFDRAANDISSAAGWLRWVCQPNAVWPLPPADMQRLRGLPNTDHLRTPT